MMNEDIRRRETVSEIRDKKADWGGLDMCGRKRRKENIRGRDAEVGTGRDLWVEWKKLLWVKDEAAEDEKQEKVRRGIIFG